MTCPKAQSMLSEYIDNALSARDTWELDKHLADCRLCARLLNELRRTVDAVVALPSFEVSEEFMARLQARLAVVEPGPARRSWQDYLTSLRSFFQPRFMGAWATAGVATTLAIVMLTTRPAPPRVSEDPAQPTLTAIVQTARMQHVALTAANPFEDVAAANLAAHTPFDPETDNESVD